MGRRAEVFCARGGLANANYWGNQVRELQKSYRVVVMDSRGHGRSTRNEQPYGYDLMAADVTGLRDFLKIPKAGDLLARLRMRVNLSAAIAQPSLTLN